MEKKTFFEKIESIKMPVRISILAGTIIVMLGAFILLVYLPKTEEIASISNSNQELTGRLNRARIQRAKLPETRAEKEQVDLQFDEALKLLPNEKEIPELLTQITALGAESNLDLRFFRPGGGRRHEFYQEIPISLELRGNYHNVAVFFERIGRMERIMNIHNVNMRPVSPRSTELHVTCEAITYTFLGD